MRDGPELTVGRWADAEALAAIVVDHAGTIRDVYEWHDYAADAFGIANRALEAIRDQPRDEAGFEFRIDDPGDLAIVYDACEYAVEDVENAAITASDRAVARRLYRRLGGTASPEPPDAATVTS